MWMNICMTNRYWTIVHIDTNSLGEYYPKWETLSDREILDEYWEYWSGNMKRAYYEKRLHGGGLELITPEKCIEHWCTVHLAERNYWIEMKNCIA
jgi:hypothetical protein